MYKSFIIHLSKIQSSLDSALNLQEALKSIDIDAELFEGTYGNEAEELIKTENRSVHNISFKGYEIDERGIAKALRPGVIGCFYSHYRLWQKCLELNETICIFEDDVDIVRSLIPVKFDDILITVLGARKNRKYLHYLHKPHGEPHAAEYLNSSMPGTPGYMITPQGADKLLNYYKNTFLPSDNAINKSVVDIKIHSYLIGEANLEKTSLTKSSKFWRAFNE
jgi:GR25 family glycosyltransferase involved in LPS biosynthesis